MTLYTKTSPGAVILYLICVSMIPIMRKTIYLPFILCCFLLAACEFDSEDGLRVTPPGDGPMVVFDLEAQPLPEIPFPNDVATRPDASSATGLRINASQIAPTFLEQETRMKIDQLDGFGTMQPISVRFDAPLDIQNLLARHRDNLDFSDDAVYLVDITPDSPTYGQAVLLDIGRGNFPLTLQSTNRYFSSDPRGRSTNVLYETTEEDLNHNGVMDPGEDTDDDGVLDHPNVWPPDSAPKDGLMTFYESETNTLIIRPVVPLREETTYAVVLTERLTGADGHPVRSPFGWVNHLDQTQDLKNLEDIFASWQTRGIDMDVDKLAFAWSFTTQSITSDLVAIREGYNGTGPLAWLADQYPPLVRVTQAKDKESDENPYLLETQLLMNVFEMVGPSLLGDNMQMVEPVVGTFDNVDYFVQGSFESADFLRTSPDGLDPLRMHSENFFLDLQKGEAAQTPTTIRFVAAIPKTTALHHPPFPVVIYCHSYSSMRAEAMGFAGYMAKHGIATVGIDAWGHGLPIDNDLADIIVTTGASFGFKKFAKELLYARARDVDGDGSNDSGADYWTAYAFHTRDVVRQSIADHFQLVRVLRSFDGKHRWDLDQNHDGELDLAGDFNGDGTIDFGGPDVDYFAWGQSGGGIHSAVLGPLEPAIIATAPTAGGGGMSDVGLRTMLGNVRTAVMLRVMGPLVVGEPVAGGTRVFVQAVLGTQSRDLDIDTVDGLRPGDLVLVTNLNKDEQYSAHIQQNKTFRISVKSDRGDRFSVAFYTPEGKLIRELSQYDSDVFFFKNDTPTFKAGDPLTFPVEGFGLARCTPDLRRMVGLFQMVLEPADPANYAPHYFLDPLDIKPEGPTVTNMLEISTLGDQSVPIQTQATIGRSAGVIPYLELDQRYDMTPNDWLIANHVYEGLAHIGRFPPPDAVFDPDNLDESTDGFDAPEPDPGNELRSIVETSTGQSGIRFAYMRPGGQHGIFPTGLESDFDVFSYFGNLVAYYFASEGKTIIDNLCLQDASCPAP